MFLLFFVPYFLISHIFPYLGFLVLLAYKFEYLVYILVEVGLDYRACLTDCGGRRRHPSRRRCEYHLPPVTWTAPALWSQSPHSSVFACGQLLLSLAPRIQEVGGWLTDLVPPNALPPINHCDNRSLTSFCLKFPVITHIPHSFFPVCCSLVLFHQEFNPVCSVSLTMILPLWCWHYFFLFSSAVMNIFLYLIISEKLEWERLCSRCHFAPISG